MATLVSEAPPPIRPAPPDPGPPQRDIWPHTSRPMPWLVAIFMFMVYLIPFDSTQFAIKLPFDAGLDRLVLVMITAVWLVLSLAGRDRPQFRHGAINLAMYLFVVVSALSLVLNLRDLAWDQELSLSFKQMLLAFTYLTFFYVVASSLRREDIPNFCRLLVVLATVSAIGTILEYRSHTNYFVDLGRLIPSAKVHMRLHFGGGPSFLRLSYGGPTKHGLADASMLVAAVPFTVVFLVRARDAWARWRYGLALLVLVVGCIATQEKTAFILLAASVIVIVAFRPRRYARLWPLLIVAVIVTRIVAPHSISQLIYQFKVTGSSESTSGRTTDYPAVAPFLNTHLLFGRGFGSYSPTKYRILDDQMLQFLINTGAIGLLAYTAVILSPVVVVFRRARRGLTLEDDLLAGIAAGCVAFFLSNFLYDSFSFRQGPYVFFFLAAMAAAAVGRRGSAPTVDELDGSAPSFSLP